MSESWNFCACGALVVNETVELRDTENPREAIIIIRDRCILCKKLKGFAK
jgi:hypothetical protein